MFIKSAVQNKLLKMPSSEHSEKKKRRSFAKCSTERPTLSTVKRRIIACFKGSTNRLLSYKQIAEELAQIWSKLEKPTYSSASYVLEQCRQLTGDYSSCAHLAYHHIPYLKEGVKKRNYFKLTPYGKSVLKAKGQEIQQFALPDEEFEQILSEMCKIRRAKSRKPTNKHIK